MLLHITSSKLKIYKILHSRVLLPKLLTLIIAKKKHDQKHELPGGSSFFSCKHQNNFKLLIFIRNFVQNLEIRECNVKEKKKIKKN